MDTQTLIAVGLAIVGAIGWLIKIAHDVGRTRTAIEQTLSHLVRRSLHHRRRLQEHDEQLDDHEQQLRDHEQRLTDLEATEPTPPF